jgi:hypothetical protein
MIQSNIPVAQNDISRTFYVLNIVNYEWLCVMKVCDLGLTDSD